MTKNPNFIANVIVQSYKHCFHEIRNQQKQHLDNPSLFKSMHELMAPQKSVCFWYLDQVKKIRWLNKIVFNFPPPPKKKMFIGVNFGSESLYYSLFVAKTPSFKMAALANIGRKHQVVWRCLLLKISKIDW